MPVFLAVRTTFRLHPAARFCGGALLAALAMAVSPVRAVAAPAFVQSNYAVPSTPQTSVTIPFTVAQVAGDLNVVVIGWSDTSTAVSSVTDTKGNAYTLAVGPNSISGAGSQSIYFARNVAAAAANGNTVTVRFSAAAPFPDIRILEYSGIDTSNPVDVSAAATGNSSTSSSGAATTHNASDLIFGANYVATSTKSAGTSFTSRMITKPDGDIAEDRIVSAVGSYSATASLSSAGPWVMQMVAFRAAGSAPPPPDTTAPTVPSNLTASAPSSTQVSLSWTASSDPDSPNITYHVERCSGSGCSSFAEIATQTGTVFTDAGLTANTSYSYRVRAADPSNNLSGYSNTASATTLQPDTTPPTVPSNLTASAAGSSQIALSWTASSDPDSPNITYHVERCPGSSCGTSFAEVGALSGTTFTDSGLSGNTSYIYRVRANDPSNNFSGYSNTASATTSSVPTAIAFVQSNYAVPATPQTSVTVPFTAAQAAGDLNVVAIGWAANSTATVSNVTDTAGNSYSAAAGPTVVSGSPGQAIYYVKNIAAAAPNGNSVTVTFSSAAPFPDVRILEYSGIDTSNPVDVSAAATGNSSTSSSGAATTHNANDLIFGANDVATSTTGPGAGFTNRMTTNPDGDIAEDRIVSAVGSYSATASLSSAGPWVMQMVAFRAAGSAPPPPDTTAPTVPSNLTASAPSSTQVSLSWTASSDPDSPNITYHVERCSGSGCSSFAEIATQTGTVFTDAGLTANTSYSYRVRAADPSSNFSNYSNIASATPVGPNPTLVGQWAGPFTWPMIGIHATLMPNGKVLTWEDENAAPAAQVWDPTSMNFTAVPYNAMDLFCSGHTVLPDGRIMVAGGHTANYNGLAALTLFSPNTQTWSAGPNMSFARWYPTVTALPDGRQLVTSGAINCQNCNANTPEIYDPVANTWTRLTNATINLPIYPHMFVLPDGRVLATSSYELPVVAQALDLKTLTWTTIDPNLIDAGSAVMYLPGKILKTGTSANSDPPYVDAVANAYVLDMTQPSPAWRQTNSMAFARSFHNLTSLPDGTVLVTGGESNTNVFDLSTAILAAELWSPASEQWTTMASMQTPRVYHSTALLLPDGRVLVAGSGEYGTGSINQLNAEIYSPPYLFKGSRPAITSAPATLQYGQPFAVQTPDAAGIASAVLIRLGSVTHAFNQNQKFVPLAFAAGSGSLTVTAPANINLAPPGHYMLFIVNSSGVPSLAQIVSLPVASGSTPPTAPTNLAGAASTGQVSLSWTGSASPFGIANYNVYRSTTAGFTPSAGNRIAQPAGTAYTDYNFVSSGTYYYLVTAVDAQGHESSPSNTAVETVSADTTPPIVALTAPANGATVSGNTAVSATASDNVVVTGVQFQVDGSNIGSAVTAAPYSVSWNTWSVLNGSHTLTAIATDGAGLSTTSASATVTVSNTSAAAISFVQGNYAVPSTQQTTVSVPFISAQAAGDLNVVVIGWSNSTSLISSVTDTQGNVYVLAVGPTAVTGLESQAIYYAKSIAAAAANLNTVTVKFNAAVPFPDVRILEYGGLDTVNPLDVAVAAIGNSAASASGAVATTNANDLIVGANYVATSTIGPGAGFTSRMITSPDGDIVEDQIVSALGSYNATANLSSAGSWVMQAVAFRAAGGSPPAAPAAPK